MIGPLRAREAPSVPARRATQLVLAAGLVLASAASPTLSALLGEEARKVIEDKLNLADLMSNAASALKLCREAEAKAAEFDRDPLYDGRIALCLGYAEMHLKNSRAACDHFARALERLQAVRADHPQHARTAEWMEWMRRDRAKLAC